MARLGGQALGGLGKLTVPAGYTAVGEALISTDTSEMNKRGRVQTSALSTELLGYQDSNLD
jgi:hypothetical protein